MLDRAAEHREREPKRVPTAEGLRAITPAYMAPEQVADLVARARSEYEARMSAIAEAQQIRVAAAYRERVAEKARRREVVAQQRRARTEPAHREIRDRGISQRRAGVRMPGSLL